MALTEGVWHPTDAGTPQGGPASPVLCNLTLDGLETLLKREHLPARQRHAGLINLVRWADDFIITYPLEGDDKADFIGGVTSGDLRIEHLSREQVSVRVFGQTAILMARDAATWLYHGREISGHYKVIMIYTLRDGHWQLCAAQACPIQTS